MIAQMQAEGELSNELLVKTNPVNFSDFEAAIFGLGNLACSSSRKAESPELPDPPLQRRHIEQLSARKTCIAGDTAVL